MGFSFSSRFREGQWRAYRNFMLNERRDAGARFAVISAEKERIGEVRVIYYTPTGSTKKTERRVGVCVDPLDSSLAKLMAAYTALGGNPFNISMFSGPDRSLDLMRDGTVMQQVPGGGIVHGKDIKYAYDQGVTGDDTNALKYRASRHGGKKLTAKEFEVLDIMDRSRGWISQEIQYKRTRLEELIVKLCDLREQLDDEVDDLIWATGGACPVIDGASEYSTSRFTDSTTAAGIAYFFDSTFRVPDPTEKSRIPYDNTAADGEAGSVNLDALSGFDSLMSDEDDEDNSAM